jgi:hypothetical protein
MGQRGSVCEYDYHSGSHPDNLLQRKKPEMCGCCHGTGQKECSWCHGTGAMTLGDTLFCSEQGCRPCPVCTGSVSGGAQCPRVVLEKCSEVEVCRMFIILKR